MKALCGNEVEMDFSFDGDKPIDRARMDVKTATITWYPLIVGDDSKPLTINSQRHHD